MDLSTITEQLDFAGEYPLLIPLVALGLVLFFILIVIDTLTTSLRALLRAKKILEFRMRSYVVLESQSDAINTHATSYTNTLGTEGAKLLIELQAIVSEQKNILSGLEVATKNWDIEKIAMIEEEPTVSNNDLFVGQLKRAETIIGYLSARLVEASMTATKLHIPRIKKSEPTIEGMANVGLLPTKQEK